MTLDDDDWQRLESDYQRKRVRLPPARPVQPHNVKQPGGPPWGRSWRPIRGREMSHGACWK
jgi:hypothetical protein